MDFVLWLQENNIEFSLKKSADNYLFTLHRVQANNGLLNISYPCMLGRTPENAVKLFILSYENFVLFQGMNVYRLEADKFEAKTIPKVS